MIFFFVASKRPGDGGGGHDEAGVTAVLQQKWKTILFFIVFLLHPTSHPHALHGLPARSLLSEFLADGKGRRRGSVGLHFRPFGFEEPASPGEPDLHQPAEQRVQRLAFVEVWAVLQDLHPEDPAADARLSAEPRPVRLNLWRCCRINPVYLTDHDTEALTNLLCCQRPWFHWLFPCICSSLQFKKRIV